MKGLLFAAVVAAGLAPSVARADEGADFIAKLSGSWTGSGSITASGGEAPAATTCRLQGAPAGSSITVTGKCDGAAKGANLAVQLTWSGDQKTFVGTFQGGAEAGTASLSGRLSGNSLVMQVTSQNGAVSTLTLTVSGANRLSLAVSGKDSKSGKPVQYVSLGLAKG
ncbi:hypothetical protein C2U72_22225 [Prosthecomicrobium hirschii]|uniref:hypothetical protein n=1 Tax=Prosthecodimorpha hirschii TaxID=665126 RepID=UPI00112EF7CD|nr:hypothetical protein [Prosthecomicrobium hirschii]TPQ48719.1 hypothetical protein C2U72_22225 [Prosthecomicrobium hirschii]